ncbi:hypothetical protein TNCV_2198781 [Trichonephila clavipes]|nr:hypothetical protein TNCV_2198781 [Trichonephila clavipes]
MKCPFFNTKHTLSGQKSRFTMVEVDGSGSGTGRAGSGLFSNTPVNDVKISIRNSDDCSVFRSELLAISDALNHALNSNKDSI